LRIGLLTGEYPPSQGGVGDFTRELARALAELGHAVHVITGPARQPDAPMANPQSLIPHLQSPFVHRAILRWDWSSLFVVRMLARELGLQAVNLQYQAAAYGLAAPVHFLPRVVGVPCAVTFHDLRVPYLFPKAGPLRWRTVLALARAARAAVVTNAEDELRLRRAGGVRCLAQIPIGSNIAPDLPADYERAAWRRRLGVAEAECLLGYFGFLNASKGGETLVRALALLRRQGWPARLVLIGAQAGGSDPTDAGYGARVEALAQELGVAPLIQATGFVPPAEVSAHLDSCDLLVLPYEDGASFRRGSLIAGLAHGCAIVSTTPAVPQPGLADGENLRLVPPGDAEACAAAAAELMDSPELRRRLSSGAQALAREFTWDKIAARTAEVLASACEER
jgi:glycosyltransferase involved in cell wall biosynthesis